MIVKESLLNAPLSNFTARAQYIVLHNAFENYILKLAPVANTLKVRELDP